VTVKCFRLWAEKGYLPLLSRLKVVVAALGQRWRVAYTLIIVFVVAVLWVFTIQGFLPEELRQAYLTYFNIVRA